VLLCAGLLFLVCCGLSDCIRQYLWKYLENNLCAAVVVFQSASFTFSTLEELLQRPVQVSCSAVPVTRWGDSPPPPNRGWAPKFSQTLDTLCGQLIIRKISKFDATRMTRCQILRLQCTEFDFRWSSAPDSAGGAYSAPPDPIAVFKEAYF